MRLAILGSSGTAPRPGNPASGYLVRGATATLWMDAGPGTYAALADHIDPEALDGVRSWFAKRRIEMPEINRRQALLPEGSGLADKLDRLNILQQRLDALEGVIRSCRSLIGSMPRSWLP